MEVFSKYSTCGGTKESRSRSCAVKICCGVGLKVLNACENEKMTTLEIQQRAQRLAAEIRRETGEKRLAHRPEFSRLLSSLRILGQPVPRALLQLDAELSDEEVERQFDNIPI